MPGCANGNRVLFPHRFNVFIQRSPHRNRAGFLVHRLNGLIGRIVGRVGFYASRFHGYEFALLDPPGEVGIEIEGTRAEQAVAVDQLLVERCGDSIPHGQLSGDDLVRQGNQGVTARCNGFDLLLFQRGGSPHIFPIGGLVQRPALPGAGITVHNRIIARRDVTLE